MGLNLTFREFVRLLAWEDRPASSLHVGDVYWASEPPHPFVIAHVRVAEDGTLTLLDRDGNGTSRVPPDRIYRVLPVSGVLDPSELARYLGGISG